MNHDALLMSTWPNSLMYINNEKERVILKVSVVPCYPIMSSLGLKPISIRMIIRCITLHILTWMTSPERSIDIRQTLLKLLQALLKAL